jgi:anthranilate synthase component 1
MHYQLRQLPDIPQLIALCRHAPHRYPYALISTASSAHNGRFDILPAFPQACLWLDANQQLHCSGAVTLPAAHGFLDSFDHWWQQQQLDHITGDVPFSGGWFIYLGYELAAEIEPCLRLPQTSPNTIIASATRCPAAVIHDRVLGRCYAVAENEFAILLDSIEHDVANLATLPPATAIRYQGMHETTAQPYLQQVTRIKKYIYEGDIFQANLSRRWQIEINPEENNIDIFVQLAHNNPGCFAAMATLGEQTIISSSPERLVNVRQHTIETRPIAGTRPRSNDNATDLQLATELLAHPKEQAEHIMLIDLERNDLGRLCVAGSILVDELMTLESYQHVHHIVSNVRGRLRDDITPAAVIRAVFPGGTITGCPKVRCMEILAELEQEARGAYTGSLGYINRDGSMDLNILIRTLVRDGNKLTLRAGGGIVADSDASAELAETRAKARGLLAAFAPGESACTP